MRALRCCVWDVKCLPVVDAFRTLVTDPLLAMFELAVP
jgi:hypothetical protein